MKHIFCPICGYKFEDRSFSLGEICHCCGTESGFQDEMEYYLLEKRIDIDILEALIPEYKKVKDINKSIEKQLSWKLLRAQWMKNGCPFVYNKNMIPWTREKAIIQLENIGIDANALYDEIFNTYKNREK